MYKITWKDRVRYVTDIQCSSSPGCSIVDNNRNDIYDLGLYPDSWSDLTIERIKFSEYLDELRKLSVNYGL